MMTGFYTNLYTRLAEKALTGSHVNSLLEEFCRSMFLFVNDFGICSVYAFMHFLSMLWQTELRWFHSSNRYSVFYYPYILRVTRRQHATKVFEYLKTVLSSDSDLFQMWISKPLHVSDDELFRWRLENCDTFLQIIDNIQDNGSSRK